MEKIIQSGMLLHVFIKVYLMTQKNAALDKDERFNTMFDVLIRYMHFIFGIRLFSVAGTAKLSQILIEKSSSDKRSSASEFEKISTTLLYTDIQETFNSETIKILKDLRLEIKQPFALEIIMLKLHHYYIYKDNNDSINSELLNLCADIQRQIYDKKSLDKSAYINNAKHTKTLMRFEEH